MKPAELFNYNAAFRALTQSLDVGVLLVTPARELAFASERARHLLHVPLDHDNAACWSEARSFIEPVLEKADPEDDAPIQETIRLDGKDGARQLRLDVFTLHGKDEWPGGHLVLLKDHDAFQRVEQTLHLAMQMHQTGRLYEALAHDLRQPIGAILIHLKVLEELSDRATFDALHQTHYDESVDTIRSEVKELDRSLRLLLRELSPSDAERAVCLQEVVQSVARLIAPQVHKEGLRLRTEISGEDCTIRGRRFRIKQAVMNLATNAIEAMQAGTLTLCLSTHDNQARIEVTDEGPGIPNDVQLRMFERHYTTKPDGTGLGLHLVKQTARAHGGQVNVKSTPGKGTTFELLLPLHTDDAPDE